MNHQNPDVPRHSSHTPWWLLSLALVAGLWLVIVFKVAGAFLALGLLGIVILASRRPDAIEIDALASSISLSAQDINDTLVEFDQFCSSPDAKNLEDRTFLRPALADKDSSVPAIAQFHEDYANAQRFLHRLPARLAGSLSVKQAERLLTITDERAELLRQSWLQARQAAREIGPS
ncbi:hypothetical protein CKALI_06765 [Corynebacterium kalinowskii]|uniref:Uncharacterized protein n=1 Tax=Corynebacterium kalinowskii TaxID=2675216 RepID=A0A6B8VTB4_9CORY|nr:hypothetical protein [Corynebacterium kalinowskii]QGU02215.1 hypothetical protein CKALI_06765 [Corynebacterium kalinowskii]